MTKAKLKNSGIALATAGPRKLSLRVSFPGKVKLNADRVVHVVPQVSGVVRQVRKKLGERVKSGEIIAVLDSREIGAAAIEYLSAHTGEETAKAKLANMTARVGLAKVNLHIVKEDITWHEKIHANTRALIERLKEKPPLDDIEREFKDKLIGENRSRLLQAYAQLIFSRYALDRETTLRKENVTSETDYQQAARDSRAAKSKYMAVMEKVGFDSLIEPMRESHKVALSEQELKVTQREAEVAEQELKEAISTLRSYRRKLRILGLNDTDIERLQDETIKDSEVARYFVRAPFDGTVIEKDIAPGEKLNGNSEIYVISDLSRVWIDLQVYRKDLPFVRKGQQTVISAGHGLPDAKGKIGYVEPLIGEETQTALARVVLPNPEGRWRPGLFVTVELVQEERTAAVAVSVDAVQTLGDISAVFVQVGDHFEVRQVKLGRSDERFVEVVEGLSPGEKYVTKNSFVLKAEWQNMGGE